LPLLASSISTFSGSHSLKSWITFDLSAGYSPRHLQQLIRLSYLAPDIISAIIDGTQPVDLTGRKILRIGYVPLCWTTQRKLLGFN